MVWFSFFKKTSFKRKHSRTILSLSHLEDRTVPTVSVLGGYQGITSTGYYPPDTVMAVGPNHVVELVNADIAIYDKATGSQIYQKSIASFFPSSYYSAGLGQFDPLVAYNDNIDRFIVTSHVTDFSAKKSFIDFAISNSSDPTKGFSETYEVEVDQGGSVWVDNGKIGYNDGVLVFSGNNYNYNDSWVGQTTVIAVDLKLALDANPSTSGVFTTTRAGNFAFIPARMHGAAPTDPLLFFESNTGGGSTIQITKGTNLLSNSPQYVDISVPVGAYGFKDTFSQPGTSVEIDAGDCRTQSVDWRNNVLVGAFSSAVNGDAAAAWIMFDAVPTGTPKLQQQGFIHPGAGIETAFPSVALGPLGDLGMTYMQASKTEYLSMYVTGRSTSDAPGTMGAAFQVKAGDCPLQDGNPSRAGDYSGVGVDPVDGTFWAANEYADKRFNSWSTWISHFSVSGLVTPIISATVSSNSVFLGDSVTFSATVSKPTPTDPIPAGKVDLIENNKVIATATLDSGGKATFPPVLMNAEGNRQFFIKYTATGSRYRDVTSSGLIVSTTGRATTLTSAVKNGDVVTSSIPFGQTVSFYAYLSAPVPGPSQPTGSVEFFINSKSYGTRSISLVNNQIQAQLKLDGLPLGSYTTYATYKGDGIYSSSVSAAVKFVVVKAGTSTVITPQSDTAVVGETFAVQGLVSAGPGARIQGRVQFRLNGSPLGAPLDVNSDGTVLLRNTFLLGQIGKNRQLTASFTDTSGNYSGSTSPVVPILITNTKTRLNVPAFAKIGDNVTFTATVSQVPGSAGTLGGFVEFFDGSKSLGTGPVDPSTGIATLSTSSLEARQYLVRARYVNTSGTGVVDSGLSAPSTLLISRGGPAVTFTTSPTSDTYFGANADFQIQVAPPSQSLPIPSGTVVLLFGAQEIFRVSLDGLGNASFSLTPDQYKVGANSVTARYLGDGNYAGSDGTTSNFNVVKAPTDTVVAVTDLGGSGIANPVPFGTSVKVRVVVTNDANNAEPKGTVLLSALINGKENPLGQLNVVPAGSGKSVGELKLDKLPVGDYQIKARFVDNDRFVGSDAVPGNLSIIPGPAAVSILGPNKFRAKGQTTLTASVDDGTGNSPVGIVRFTNLDNSQVLGEATVNTDKNGSLATLNFTNTFGAGPVNVKAEFISSKPGTNNADTQVQLTITDKPSKFGITVSSSSVRVGDSLTINVSLDVPVPADFDPAAVQITDNGNIIKSGDITLSSPFVQSGNTFKGAYTYALTTVGTHRLTARYLGTVYTEPAETAPMDVLARPRVVSTTSTSSVIISDAAAKAASTVLTSENLKLVATVSNTTTSINPDGTLTFVAIKNGVETTLGSVAVKPLSTNQAVGELLLPSGISPSGTYSLVARFTSTGDFAASASQGKSLKVVDGPAAVTFVGLTTLLSGTNTTLTVKVDDGTGRTPTGKVTFYNDATSLGSVDLVGGQAALNLPNGLPGGILPIRAEFVSATFAGANNSVTQNFTVQADTKVTLLTDLLAYKSTDLITVNITVEFPTNLPAAKVQLTDNGRLIATLTLTLNNTTGKFETSYPMTGLSIGSHRLVAKYLGTDLTSVKETAPRTIIVRR